MESTPFDEAPDEPVASVQLEKQSGAPMQPRPGRPLLWIVPLAVVALVLAVIGFNFQRQNAANSARETKLAALRGDIKKIVLQDNALVLEMLDDGALQHITYAEFFKRADKNKEERDNLIRTLRATEAGPYGEQVGHFVKLMEGENEWVRAEEAVSRAGMEASGKWEAYKRVSDASEEASQDVADANTAYLAAPYGYDYAEKAQLDIARARVDSMSEGSKDAFDEWKTAQDDLGAKKNSAAVTVADWMRNEPNWYPNFAPKRDITDLLRRKKLDYVGTESGSSGDSASVTKTSDDKKSTPETEDTEPQSTPEPAVPTRVHALEDLAGERFPQTRTRDLDADEIGQMSDEDVRYAINEMFARYGMTFRDKDLQAEFEPYKWYQPNDKWTPNQIERQFSKREKHNADLLAAERSARKSYGSEE